MAFRADLLPKLLPFPDRIPQHDMWIGLINEVYGKSFFIDKSLIQYRRHSNNASFASSNKRGTAKQMLGWRFMLIKCLVARTVSLLIGKKVRPGK